MKSLSKYMYCHKMFQSERQYIIDIQHCHKYFKVGASATIARQEVFLTKFRCLILILGKFYRMLNGMLKHKNTLIVGTLSQSRPSITGTKELDLILDKMQVNLKYRFRNRNVLYIKMYCRINVVLRLTGRWGPLAHVAIYQ